MRVGYDVDYNARVGFLADLMRLKPTASVRRLRREALKYYPLYHPMSTRFWMTSPYVEKQAKEINDALAHASPGHAALE